MIVCLFCSGLSYEELLMRTRAAIMQLQNLHRTQTPVIVNENTLGVGQRQAPGYDQSFYQQARASPTPTTHQTRLFTAVLRIHDILVLIRFSGSMPTLTNRFGSCYYRQRPSRRQQKLIFKDKKSKRSHKTVGINVVLTIFA
jgi:hypothetical protein